MGKLNSNEIGNEILAFTPARVFFWLMAILAGAVLQLIIGAILHYAFTFNLEEGVLSVWLFFGESIAVVALFQCPLYAIVKLFSVRAILKIRKGSFRNLVIISLALFLTTLAAIYSFDLMYGGVLGRTWISLIGPLFAAIIGIIDALVYVFLLGRIFQSQKVIVNDSSD